jgi:hypothetical protein
MRDTMQWIVAMMMGIYATFSFGDTSRVIRDDRQGTAKSLQRDHYLVALAFRQILARWFRRHGVLGEKE